MNLGPLNRRARVWANTPTRGLGGAVSDVLSHLLWLFVTVGEVDNPNAAEALRDSTMQKLTLTSRWTVSVANKQVIDFEGTRYRVVRIRVLGRREGLIIYCEQIA